MFAFLTRAGRAARRRRRRPSPRLVLHETLEPRLALSASPSSIVMQSATATGPRSVEVRYSADPTAAGLPLRFGVYRSADATFGPADELVATYDVPAAALAPGRHDLTVPLADGLPIDVARPYVLVVANPDAPGASTDLARSAAFRKFTIGVVTHGGIINPSWTHGSPWQLQIGRLMQRQGYDVVIPYDWIRESSTPGRAAPQGPKLANQIERLLDKLPADTVVDLHLIGHSQGTVVNMVALQKLEQDAPPQLGGGWIQETLLDPHAANNNVPGQMDTSNTIIGGIAHSTIFNYQADAKDPTVVIPTNVDEADVYYQHTYVRDIHLMTPGGYNLWGQVPVPNPGGAEVHYYNLTATGATHSGNSGVPLWYRNFVAPTLAAGSPLVHELRLDGTVADASPTPWQPTTALDQRAAANWGVDQLVEGDRPIFAGSAAPGATVRVYVGPASDLSKIPVLATTTADASGGWTATSIRPLAPGRYRAVAMAYSRALQTRPAYAVVSMTPMGGFWIGRDPRALKA